MRRIWYESGMSAQWKYSGLGTGGHQVTIAQVTHVVSMRKARIIIKLNALSWVTPEQPDFTFLT